MFLEMMVIRILKHVPEEKDLHWKIWDTLRIDFATKRIVWRNAVDIDWIKEIARACRMVRGRKADKNRLVFEGQCFIA